MAAERGQASLELAAGLPVLLLAGALCLQLLAVGHALTLVDGAAEAGALALVAGRPPEPAVRAALPGWGRPRVSVSAGDGRVAVRLRPRALLPGLGERLAVSSSAWARRPSRGSGR